MEYLLLWSGEARGMRKARIPAFESNGLAGHWRDGKLWIPDAAAIRAALPFRYRAAFDRACGVFWFDKRGKDFPASMHLNSSRGKWLVTLYLQPLKGE
jgi:hypothetical protein